MILEYLFYKVVPYNGHNTQKPYELYGLLFGWGELC